MDLKPSNRRKSGIDKLYGKWDRRDFVEKVSIITVFNIIFLTTDAKKMRLSMKPDTPGLRPRNGNIETDKPPPETSCPEVFLIINGNYFPVLNDRFLVMEKLIFLVYLVGRISKKLWTNINWNVIFYILKG